MQNAYGAQELRIIVGAQNATSGTVSMPLTGWSTPFTVGANGTATVIVPAAAEHLGSETVSNKSVRVQANDSVTVTAVSFQSFTHEAAQVLPLPALGTRYRVEAFRGLPGFSEFYKSELLVVATENNTSIVITPSVATSGGRPAGVPFTVNLNAGETYQVQGAVSANDLTGTLIEGSATNGPCRPFAVFGGSMCANVPVACPACDHLFEQMTPVAAWGSSYHTVLFTPSTSHTLRITAHQNGTSVMMDGAPLATLNAGDSHVINGKTTASCITSSQPVNVVQIMEGFNCAGAGDPSMIVLTPDVRTTTSVSWRAMGSSQVNNHRAVVVMPTSAINQLTLNGTAVNAALFNNYPSCPGMSRAVIPVAAGTNTLSSSTGFVAYAIGIGTGESYAFPLGNNAPPVPPPQPIICSSGPVTLSAPIPVVNAWWDVQSAPGTVIHTGPSYTFTPTANDVYTVHAELPGSGCPYSYSWPIGVAVDPSIVLTANGTPGATVCQYSPVQLNATPAPNPAFYQIAWSPANLVSDPTIPDPIAYPLQSTWFKLQVTSPVGCGSFLDSVLVNVTPNSIHAVEAMASDSAICVGETIQLQARVQRIVAADLFDTGLGSMWNSVQGATTSSTCGSVSGQALYFNGGAPRQARTTALNVSTGGRLHFSLKIANGSAPCEDADPGENVVLEYSTNGGSNWTVLSTFLENAYPNFTALSINIPAAAQTANTIFRWSQPVFTGAGQDNWAMDNVIITRYDATGTTIAWSPSAGATNPSAITTNANPPATGTITLTVSIPGNPCAFTDDMQVVVQPAFSVTLSPDTTSCVAGSPVQLLATPNGGSGITYAWTPNNGTLNTTSAANPVATPTTTTTYQVTATNNIGCTATGSTTITVGQLTGMTASSSAPVICAGGSVQLTATGSGAFTYAWSPAALVVNPSSATTSAQPSVTTTFTCTVAEPSTGCTATATTTVFVNGPYTVTSSPDDSLCSTNGVQLDVQHNVSGPHTISWTPAAFLNVSNIATPTITVDTSAVFVVTVTDALGCMASDTTVIVMAFDDLLNPAPFSACDGDDLILNTGYPGLAHAWSTGETGHQITVTASGTYTATITDGQGCEAILDHVVTFTPQPLVNLGPDLVICGSGIQVLDASSPGYTVLWSNGATTQQIQVSSTGDYSVLVTTPQGCTESDTVHVQIDPMPVDNLQDISACETTPVLLDAGNTGSTYAWSTGATTQSILASASGTYTVTVTTPANCTGTFDAVVLLIPTVSVDLGPDTAFCAGQSLVLDAGIGTQYLWNTGATTSTLTVTQAGLYSVVVTAGTCSGSDTVVINTWSAPVNTLVNTTACSDAPVVLNAGNPGSTYLWNTGATTSTLSAPASGSYTVTVTNAHDCSATFTAQITYVEPPEVELGPDTVLCDGEVLLLDAGPDGSQYTWNNGATGRTTQAASAGTYTVNVGNGYCVSTDSIHLYFNPSPARMAARQLFTCLDEEPHYVLLDAGNPGSQYAWSTGSNAQVILAAAYGWYHVEVTNVFDCALRDSVTVIEYCPPSIYVPNTFTPNGDGVNDIWMPVGKSIGTMELEVFDRWGGIIFTTTDPTRGWDGTFNGQPLPNDVYVWRMSYRFLEDREGGLGNERQGQGHVTLLR